MKKKLTDIKEDSPTNSMGASDATQGTGAITTYNPLLKVSKNRRDQLLRRFQTVLKKKKP
jgi:hypothetical protein